ncbi:MAG: pyruvate synthase subunit beta, partial [Candidatus Heimdallarchaeota archaeon]|nr:pyruvate synthase subunit beta [Candidatus Heimdallarchaeota archaeon]
GEKTIVSVPPSCMSVFAGTFPSLNWDTPYLHMQFANLAGTITGISRALKAQGKDDIVVIGFGGDGGTADMGLQSLSGAAHRDENILYICYNNEAYENTGIQASGSSPIGVWSSTTPIEGEFKGNEYFPKDIPRILIAHNSTYVATASTSHIQDFIRKVEKAKNMKGFRYIEVLSVCAPGWRIPTDIGPELVKEAVDSGYWLLFEYESGNLTINKNPKFEGLEEFLKKQGRFKHITQEQLDSMKNHLKKRWKIINSYISNNEKTE